MVELKEICDLQRGVVYSKKDEVLQDGSKILRANNITLAGNLILEDIKLISKDMKLKESQKLIAGDIFICLASGSKDHIGKVAYIDKDTDNYFGGFMGAIRTKNDVVEPLYLFYLLKNYRFNEYLGQTISGANINNLNSTILSTYRIPLPPLEVQEQIVAELDSYQKIIDGARQVIENYKPHIDIDPSWPVAELGDIFKLSSGRFLPKKEQKEGKYFVYGGNGVSGMHNEYFLDKPTLIIGRVGEYCGAVHITKEKSWATDNALYVTQYIREIDQKFLYYSLLNTNLNQYAKRGGQPSLSQSTLHRIKIYVPHINIQQEIARLLKKEQKLVEATEELIGAFEQKIKDRIAKVWGE